VTDPSGLHPPGPLVRDVDEFVERLRPISGALISVTGLEKLFEIATGIKRARLDEFLRALRHAEGELDLEHKNELEELLSSTSGQELLTDYADTILRTSSRIAISALGILYANRDRKDFPDSFRRNACEGLFEISDDLVETFLALVLHATKALSGSGSGPVVHQVAEGAIDRGGPYVVVLLKGDQTANAVGRPLESLIVAVRRLTERGLLLPDHAGSGARFGGATSLTFGIGDETRRYERLLRSARSRLHTGE
jgi:hypothetical protein